MSRHHIIQTHTHFNSDRKFIFAKSEAKAADSTLAQLCEGEEEPNAVKLSTRITGPDVTPGTRMEVPEQEHACKEIRGPMAIPAYTEAAKSG